MTSPKPTRLINQVQEVMRLQHCSLATDMIDTHLLHRGGYDID
ncbi:MAG: hypothetical protein AAFY20_14020 [Cyanobacteria bacterium J06639_14]